MFHSNQRLSIDGDKDDDLKLVLNLALKLYSGDRYRPESTPIKAYKIDGVGRLVFANESEIEGYIAYPMDVSLGMAVEIIKSYLKTANPRDFMSEPDGDGSVYKGWHVCMPACNSSADWFHAIVAVEPCYTFYHK